MTMGKAHGCSEAEWQARVDLAAAYRLTDHFGMTTLIYNHITARVPGTEDQFLINELWAWLRRGSSFEFGQD